MTTHKNQVGQAGNGVNGGEFARKVNSFAADEVLAPFAKAREEQLRATRATMVAAAEAIPGVVTAYDEDIATVYFDFDAHYGLYPTHLAEENGSKFPVGLTVELHEKIFDVAASIHDYAWLEGPESPFEKKGDAFTLRVPGTDPVGRHIRMTTGESSWSLALEALQIIRDRETVEDEDFLALTAGDIDAFSEDYIERAVLNLCYELAPEYTEEADVDDSRTNEITEHLLRISNESGYNTMNFWLEAAYDRELVDDAAFLALTTEDVHRLYDMHVAHAIDKIEDRINYYREDDEED